MRLFQMILPDTLADVRAVEDGTAEAARTAEADAAAARTRADYGRVSRWGLGILGTAGALVGTALLSIAVMMMTTHARDIGDVLFAMIVLLVAAAIAVPSIWLLVALHRSGRRLARAAGYWAGLPYRQGRRAPTPGDWFAVRFLAYSGDLLLRVITGALSALAAVFTVSGAVHGIASGDETGSVLIFTTWSVVFVAVCVGQFGGVQRIQNGYTARDPWTFARRARR